MMVTVFLHSTLLTKSPQELKRRVEVEINEEATILDIVHHLEIDMEPDRLLLALNGEVTELDQKLSEGDQVHLMLPISGGTSVSERC